MSIFELQNFVVRHDAQHKTSWRSLLLSNQRSCGKVKRFNLQLLEVHDGSCSKFWFKNCTFMWYVVQLAYLTPRHLLRRHGSCLQGPMKMLRFAFGASMGSLATPQSTVERFLVAGLYKFNVISVDLYSIFTLFDFHS